MAEYANSEFVSGPKYSSVLNRQELHSVLNRPANASAEF